MPRFKTVTDLSTTPPTVTQVQYTAQEEAAADAAATAGAAADVVTNTRATNKATLLGKAQTAITANATFLAIGSPSNAQVLAQTQTLTKENTAIIRLLCGALGLDLTLLDSTSGT